MSSEDYAPYAAGATLLASAAVIGFVAFEKLGLGQTIEHLLPPPPGSGKTYDVSVTVLDSSGQTVPEAAVTLGTAGGVTNSAGVATFQGVTAGNYSITITALGFDIFDSSATIGPTSTFSFTLTPTSTCSPQSCGCGQSWVGEPICACQPQAPASLSAPPSYVFAENWQLWADSITGGTCAEVLPGAPVTGCPGSPAACGLYGDSTTFPITVKVLDDRGNPVCGVDVDGSLSTTLSNPVSVTISNFLGSCSMSCQFAISIDNPNTVTNDQGEATFAVTIQAVDVVNNGCTGEAGTGQSAADVSFLLSASVPGTALPGGVTNIIMQAIICGYGFL